MLVRSSAARAVRARSSSRAATTGARVLLESSFVARVLLGTGAGAAECSCAGDCLAIRPEKTMYPPRRLLFISVGFILYRIFVPLIALRVTT